MIPASEGLSHSLQVVAQPAENLIPPLLKALIAAIAVVVGGIFGFLLADLVGALVGSLALGSFAFGVTHLFGSQRSGEAVLALQQVSPSMETELLNPLSELGGEESEMEGEALPRLAERVDALTAFLEVEGPHSDPSEMETEDNIDLPTVPALVLAAQPVQEVQEIQSDPTILSLAGTNSSYFVQMLSLHRENRQGTNSQKNLRAVIEKLTSTPFTSAAPFLPVALSDAASGRMGIYPMGELSVLRNPGGKDSLLQPSSFCQLFDPEQELAIAYSLPGNSQSPYEENMPGYLDRLLCAIVRVVSYGEVSNEEKTNLKKHLNEKLLPIFASPKTLLEQLSKFTENRRLVSNFKKKIEEPTTFYKDFQESLLQSQDVVRFMGDLVSSIEPLPLTLEERELFKHPCPLVFASTRRDPVLDLNFLRIGKDLQYVYAAAEDMERVRAVLKNPADGQPYEIEVRDLATLSVI